MRIVAVILFAVLLYIPQEPPAELLTTEFINVPSTASSHGMAESGVSLVDFGLQGINPATIGLAAVESKAAVSFTPVYNRPYAVQLTDASALHFAGMYGKPLLEKGGKPVVTAGLAYSFTRFKIPYWLYRTPDYEQLTQHRLTLSVASLGVADVSIGATIIYNRFSEKYGTTLGASGKGSGVALDLGALFRYRAYTTPDERISLIPAFGVSYLSLGPDVTYKYELSAFGQRDLVLTRRFKAGGSFTLETPFGLPNCLVSVDYDTRIHDVHDDFKFWRLGAAAGLTDMATVRFGSLVHDDMNPLQSWGFTLVPTAWIRFIMGPNNVDNGDGSLLRQIDVKVEYSKCEEEYSYPLTNGHWLNISLVWQR